MPVQSKFWNHSSLAESQSYVCPSHTTTQFDVIAVFLLSKPCLCKIKSYQPGVRDLWEGHLRWGRQTTMDLWLEGRLWGGGANSKLFMSMKHEEEKYLTIPLPLRKCGRWKVYGMSVNSPLSERTLWRMLERCIFLSRTPALRYSLSNRSRNRRSSHTSSSIAAAQTRITHI